MRKTIAAILTLLSVGSSGQSWLWARAGVGNAVDEGMSVSIDNAGNAFITGSYSDSTLTFGSYILPNGTGSDRVYVAKYDPNGNVLWAKNSTGPAGNNIGNSICNDMNGNAYVTGLFSSSPISFGTYSLSSGGFFLTKYDPNGNVLWTLAPGGPGSGSAFSAATDASGNVYVTGSFGLSIVIGTATLTTGTPSASNIFLIKFDSNGNVLWARSGAGSGSSDYGISVSTDLSGNAYITGYFDSPSLTLGSNTITSGPGGSAFLAKYDTNGNCLWAKSAGSGINSTTGNSVCTDQNKHVYWTGGLGDPLTVFGSYTVTSSGSSSPFLVKYDSLGNALWAKSCGGTLGDEAFCIRACPAGIFMTGGLVSPSAVFGTYTLTPAPGGDAMFFVKWDANGNVISAVSLAGGGDDQNAVATDQFCNIYITGDFAMNPFVIGTNTLTLSGAETVFIAKYSDPTGIEHLAGRVDAMLYPNPNHGSFAISGADNIADSRLLIYDSLGQLVHEQNLQQGNNTVSVPALVPGLYQYLISGAGGSTRGKLLIE